ncbi:MAG: hypothetical protein GXP36_12045 [Actinobacteria bacterium]|nr:hypothetical protein [Actinomycetota bacterium]
MSEDQWAVVATLRMTNCRKSPNATMKLLAVAATSISPVSRIEGDSSNGLRSSSPSANSGGSDPDGF